MAINGAISAVDTTTEIFLRIGEIMYWLQALGIVILIWIAFQITSIILNRKKLNELRGLKEEIKNLHAKVESLSKKK